MTEPSTTSAHSSNVSNSGKNNEVRTVGVHDEERMQMIHAMTIEIINKRIIDDALRNLLAITNNEECKDQEDV